MADGSSPSKVVIYGDPSSSNLDTGALADFLGPRIPARAEVRGEFFTAVAEDIDPEVIAVELARLRVRGPSHPPGALEPLLGEVQFERRGLADPARLVPGILYDGWAFMALLRGLLSPRERTLDHLHIVLTPRLLATLDADDLRYHARTILLGFPCIISTSGLVEAPAKPREYYLLRRRATALGQGLPTEVLKEPFHGQFLDYGDERLTEVVKGYALQALAYYVLGEAFCPDPHCRLFNAHWQREMLQAQLESAGLCERHSRLLQRT